MKTEIKLKEWVGFNYNSGIMSCPFELKLYDKIGCNEQNLVLTIPAWTNKKVMMHYFGDCSVVKVNYNAPGILSIDIYDWNLLGITDKSEENSNET